MSRLFVALKIPDNIKAQILELIQNEVDPLQNLKWEAIEKIHITLKFIGEVKPDMISKIESEINFICSYQSFNCELSRFDFFDGRSGPKILWAGLTIDKIIYELVDEINNCLVKFSIPADTKKYFPHITLLRVRNKLKGSFISKVKQMSIPEIKFNMNEAALVNSQLDLTGSKYFEIKKYNLL